MVCYEGQFMVGLGMHGIFDSIVSSINKRYKMNRLTVLIICAFHLVWLVQPGRWLDFMFYKLHTTGKDII